MAKNAKGRGPAVRDPSAIAEISVAGFKSISKEQSIEIRPLTILAGANSSGKSSIMQPLLLLKQTLEAPYDAGSIKLDGPILKFTLADQLLSRIGKGQSLDSFHVGMRLNNGEYFKTQFRKEDGMGFGIKQMEISEGSRKFALRLDMSQAEIVKTGITKSLDVSMATPKGYARGQWEIMRDRCFLGPYWVAKGPDGASSFSGGRPGAAWEVIIPQIIHLPGLRGNPERTYAVTAVGTSFPGTFENYTASVIRHWISKWWTGVDRTIEALRNDLLFLKLAGAVDAKTISDVQIEVDVGRLPDAPPAGEEDMVNIADVGLGVSQTLPVLVALHVAKPGQLVHVEQPETHLHPRAQFALAQVLASAAKRGVRTVVETHSSTLLLGVQALVAEGSLDPEKVKLHWFKLDKHGRTTIRSGELDEAGAFGEWPQDFDDVMLETQKKYLDAADKRMFAR